MTHKFIYKIHFFNRKAGEVVTAVGIACTEGMEDITEARQALREAVQEQTGADEVWFDDEPIPAAVRTAASPKLQMQADAFVAALPEQALAELTLSLQSEGIENPINKVLAEAVSRRKAGNLPPAEPTMQDRVKRMLSHLSN